MVLFFILYNLGRLIYLKVNIFSGSYITIIINQNLTAYRQMEEGRTFLFNDALTLYLQLHGIGHMVKDHSVRERERNVLFNDALNIFYLRLYG